MKVKWHDALACVVFAAGLLPVDAFAQAQVQGNTAEVARKLVTQSAHVKSKEIVFITGGIRDIDLLDDIAIEVGRVGALAVVTTATERRARQLLEQVPAGNDAAIADAALRLVGVQTTVIDVDFVENPGFLSGVSPERMAAANKASQPVEEARMQRGVKYVNLGNGLYPTEALARRFAIAKDDLARIFWDGVNTDYTRLEATGNAVGRLLGAGRQLRLTDPNGTDIRMRIEARPVFVSDGVISDEDVKKGGPACMVWLPAGEVYLTPVGGTAEGAVVIDRSYFQDQEIVGLKLVFKAGKLTSMTAKSGLDRLQAQYDATGAGKDEFAFVDVGINPSVRVPPNSGLQSYVPAGMVTVGIGGNTWAGGTNSVPFGHHGFFSRSTLEVDGKVIVDKGVLSPELVTTR